MGIGGEWKDTWEKGNTLFSQTNIRLQDIFYLGINMKYIYVYMRGEIVF